MDFITFERDRGGKVMKPFVDGAFKYLFGREESKQLTIGFLNLLLKRSIVDIRFLPAGGQDGPARQEVEL